MREEVSSEEEWRNIITATDNGEAIFIFCFLLTGFHCPKDNRFSEI